VQTHAVANVQASLYGGHLQHNDTHLRRSAAGTTSANPEESADGTSAGGAESTVAVGGEVLTATAWPALAPAKTAHRSYHDAATDAHNQPGMHLPALRAQVAPAATFCAHPICCTSCLSPAEATCVMLSQGMSQARARQMRPPMSSQLPQHRKAVTTASPAAASRLTRRQQRRLPLPRPPARTLSWPQSSGRMSQARLEAPATRLPALLPTGRE